VAAQEGKSMRRYLGTLGLLSLITAIGLATGCTKPALRDKPPPDPLLTSKKPVEGKPHISDARTLIDEGYSPPPRPVIEDEVRPARPQAPRPVSGLR
jgi:hypothetical protein